MSKSQTNKNIEQKPIKQRKPGSGRPPGQTNTVRHYVLSTLKSLDVKKKLDTLDVNGLVKLVKEKFKDSKFDIKHAVWYRSLYRRMRNGKHTRKKPIKVPQEVAKDDGVN